MLRGAVFGAVGFEVIKSLGAFYVGRTTSKGEATYGTFAVVVGLLLFLNLVSRLILLTAAFVVTSPYDSDVLPSGSADGRRRRLPRRLLLAAVPAASWAPRRSSARRREPVPVPVADLPVRRQVVRAARVVNGLGAVALGAVLVSGVRTLVRLRRD